MKAIRGTLLSLCVIAFALDAFRSTLSIDEGAPASTLVRLSLPVMLACLCLADAQMRGRRPPMSTWWLLAVAFPVSMPAYAVWSRGGWGLIVFGLMSVLFVAASALGSILAFALLP